MKVAVLSDSHDHIRNLEKVVEALRGQVEAAIFCGDFCAPFSAGVLSGLSGPIYACLGNNDEDHLGLMKKGGPSFTWSHLSQEFGRVELGGRKIAFCHYPKLGELLAKSGDFEAVFYGHTHQSRNELLGQSLLVNPGAICGILEGKPSVASYALYETEMNQAKIINL